MDNPEITKKFKTPHPLGIALSEEMKLLLIEKLGGVGNFWIEMVQSAMHWFEPGEDSPEYLLFVGQLFIAGGMAAGTDHEEKIAEAGKTFRQWDHQPDLIQGQLPESADIDDLIFEEGIETVAGLHEPEHGRNPNDAVFMMRQRFDALRGDKEQD